MSADIQIHEMSALATGVDKSNGTVRFKAANNSTVDANDSLNVPTAGTNYSYSKKLRPYMATGPDTQVNNLRWYTDGGNGFGAGIGVTAKNLGTTWAANINTAQSGGSNLFGYTSASPLDGDGVDAGPFTSADAAGYIGDLVELQMSVASTASHGSLAGETLTLAYDEI